MRLCLLRLLPFPFSSGQNVTFPPVALWVTVGLAVCLFVLLIALAAVCRRKIKESCEEARREGKAKQGVTHQHFRTSQAELWQWEKNAFNPQSSIKGRI